MSRIGRAPRVVETTCFGGTFNESGGHFSESGGYPECGLEVPATFEVPPACFSGVSGEEKIIPCTMF